MKQKPDNILQACSAMEMVHHAYGQLPTIMLRASISAVTPIICEVVKTAANVGIFNLNVACSDVLSKFGNLPKQGRLFIECFIAIQRAVFRVSLGENRETVLNETAMFIQRSFLDIVEIPNYSLVDVSGIYGSLEAGIPAK